LLLRWYSRPTKPANSNMSLFSLRAVKLIAPLALATTSFVFLCPSWSDKTEAWSNFYSSMFLALCFSFLAPMSIWSRLVLPFTSRSRLNEREADYYRAQYMWSTEMKYHKDQFIYKKLPESVNPEYLKPGDQASVSEDMVKATYGEATMQVAEDAALPQSTITLAGGRVIADSKPSTPSASTAQPLCLPLPPSPTAGGPGRPPAYGVPTATMFGLPSSLSSSASAPPLPPPPPTGSGSAAAESLPEAPSLASQPPLPSISSEPDRASKGSRRSWGASWEFEVKRGWEAFDMDCQEELEKHYQQFLAGTGPSEVFVQTHETRGRRVSIHFNKMTSRLEGGRSRIRAIRRKETE